MEIIGTCVPTNDKTIETSEKTENEDNKQNSQTKNISGEDDQWLGHAALEHETNAADLTIVNDDLETSYQQLKEYCLSMYWQDLSK